MTGETTRVDGLTFSTAYGYDSLDNVDTVTYPGTGTIVHYSPDVLGRPTAASPFVTGAVHSASGNLSSLTYANGATTTFTENSRQLVTGTRHVKNSAFADYTYGYDNVGNVTSITNAVGSDGPNWTLTYDDLDRLTNASGTAGGSISYDGMGNITSYNFGGVNRTLTYTNNRLAAVSGSIARNYTYDAAGNVKSNGANAFQYDGASNLRCVDCTSSAFV